MNCQPTHTYMDIHIGGARRMAGVAVDTPNVEILPID